MAMFEIVVRSRNTGGVWYTDGGFSTREAAEEEARAVEAAEEDYWCEVRTERY